MPFAWRALFAANLACSSSIGLSYGAADTGGFDAADKDGAGAGVAILLLMEIRNWVISLYRFCSEISMDVLKK